ncbi:MAG: PQQ-binding-like beta-propeller repeat protein, partial [Planctomycetaceae bacterium]|nr:PQQ-binding-like beta-propeller repeat protein [Planctomycetaceae bacterium]
MTLSHLWTLLGHLLRPRLNERARISLSIGICLTLLNPADRASGDEWTRFRGPDGTGISDLQGVPLEWTESDYEWVVELPGKGHSSPVIWGDSLFVASGDDGG